MPPATAGSPLMRCLDLLTEGIERGLHLGGQIAVHHRGKAVLDEAFGEARPGEPMRRDHLMLWVSATKPVTAVAVARLWERDLLGLDDPVTRHIPEFGVNGKERITVRHLLTHTGGIRLLGVGWPEEPWDAIIARICAMKPEPRWRPGTKAGYHLASSWFLLAELVRRLDGRAIERWAREELFEPLRMDDCWVGMPAERFHDYGGRIAPTFKTDSGSDPPEAHRWDDEAHVTRPSPAGGGRGPMRELARFYRMLVAGGTLDSRRYLAPQTVSAITAHQRVGLYDHTFRSVLDWGFGFVLNSAHYGDPEAPYGYGERASYRTFGHSGFRSTTAFADPENDLVVALGVNGTPSDAAHRRRFHAALTALYDDLGIPGPTAANTSEA